MPPRRTPAAAAAGARTTAFLNSLPAPWKAIFEDKWEHVELGDTELVLQTEDEFLDTTKNECFINTFMHNADAMESYLESSGIENTLMGRYLALFPNVQLEKLVEFTNQELAARGQERADAHELRKHFCLMWARGMYNFSTAKLWVHELAAAAEKHRFVLPTHKRFIELMLAVRGFPVTGRRGDHDDVWNQSNTNFKRLQIIAELLLEPSHKILNLKGGNVVLDDELYASKSRSDVEMKTISDRKTGGEGPVGNMVADSSDSKVYAVRLRMKGETEVDNVEKTIDQLPDLISNTHSIDSHIDRGYGKKKMIEILAKKGFNVLTMAAAAGSRHAWLTKDEVDAQVKKWVSKGKSTAWINDRVNAIKDFILPSDAHMGTFVKIAKRKMSLDNGKEISLYAIAIHDCHDRKTASKLLRIFATGDKVEQLKNVIVGMKKDSGINSCTLFYHAKTPVAAREEVEKTLLDNGCGPISLSQRDGPWFAGKGGRVCGTMATKFAVNELPLETAEQKQEMLEKCIDSWFKRHHSSSAMKAGSDNEVPLSEHIQQYDFVRDLYDNGLFEKRDHPEIGVTPDAIVRMFARGETVLATGEWKTRLSEERSIRDAEAAATAHGKHVVCDLNDEGKYYSFIPKPTSSPI